MKNVKFKEWFDRTVSVEIEEGKFLRKLTPLANFDLSDQPYHWGNWTTATEMFLEYVKLQSKIAEEEFQRKRKCSPMV